MNRSYYADSIVNFLTIDEDKLLGQLTRSHNFATDTLQRNAWLQQITILKDALSAFNRGQIYFEFLIPRMGKRVDNIVLIDDFIFVLEFKIGEQAYTKHAVEQAIDYCLDLQNFHEGSHHQKLVPMLIASKALPLTNQINASENLFEIVKCNKDNLGANINKVLLHSNGTHISPEQWESSIYKPTPTIIEASQALYRGHSVTDISRSDAGAINLSKTTACINRIIETSKQTHAKSICFLTGVPGAGKTLAGLNIANERRKAHEDENAVFLSGNGPLVYVLREALIRDEVLQAKENGLHLTKKKSAIKANAFIQNIHHFRDDNIISQAAPNEKVVVFDEAQRAWTRAKASSFMKSKGKDFEMSEPEFLIDVMNRHHDYCTIICLIGGGQEINTGEAGLSEWILALKEHYPDWKIHYSNLIVNNNDYLSDEILKEWLCINGTAEPELHLSISVRSFRSEKVSDFVHAVINGHAHTAKSILASMQNQFPIVLTRDLSTAQNWLRSKAKGSERIGVVGSSGARRLRPLGIDVKNTITAEDWFLNESTDVRSSHYLELVATEFDIQGLEIDYVCLAWDINYYYHNDCWHYQSFEGTNWKQIRQEVDQQYLRNAYRVLMTRARQGLIIYVPHGNPLDHTRPVELYDSTYHFLSTCGIPTL